MKMSDRVPPPPPFFKYPVPPILPTSPFLLEIFEPSLFWENFEN